MMTPAQFDAWLTHMGLSERRAAEVLGVAPSTIGQWRRVSTPPLLGLACAALAAGLKPWVPPAHAFARRWGGVEDGTGVGGEHFGQLISGQAEAVFFEQVELGD